MKLIRLPQCHGSYQSWTFIHFLLVGEPKNWYSTAILLLGCLPLLQDRAGHIHLCYNSPVSVRKGKLFPVCFLQCTLTTVRIKRYESPSFLTGTWTCTNEKCSSWAKCFYQNKISINYSMWYPMNVPSLSLSPFAFQMKM